MKPKKIPKGFIWDSTHKELVDVRMNDKLRKLSKESIRVDESAICISPFFTVDKKERYWQHYPHIPILTTNARLTDSVLHRQPDIIDTYAIWDGIDRTYRYVLYREWNASLPHMVIIGLNPSAADEEYDDRTVRRCINFARREGCGSLSMLNAFALRATNPAELLQSSDPIGIENDHYIWLESFEPSKIVIAWGTHGKLFNRQETVLRILKRKTLYCFGVNKDGTPKHPLYLSNNTRLELWGK